MSRTKPCSWRSSGMNATPALRISSVVSGNRSLPSSSIRPESTRRNPMIVSARSRWPLPFDTGDTDDLAPTHLQREPVQASAVHIVELQRARSRFDLRLLETEQHRSAHHHLGELRLRRLGRGGLPDHGPTSEHGDAIGDLEDLIELVADEHDRLAVVPEPTKVVEQLGGLCGRQDRGWLVQDQDLDATVERLQDLDPLLLADRQGLDDGRGVDLEPVGRRRVRRPWLRSPPGRGWGRPPCRG